MAQKPRPQRASRTHEAAVVAPDVDGSSPKTCVARGIANLTNCVRTWALIVLWFAILLLHGLGQRYIAKLGRLANTVDGTWYLVVRL